MIEQDTIKLMRECDAGIKRGIQAIDEVISDVKKTEMLHILQECKQKHIKLQDELQISLNELHDSGKEPNPMAKGMSWIKTNAKMAVENSDKTIADLLTDGCNMGVKSLSRYLNQYAAADERSKNICKDLIKLEEKLSEDLRDYL